MADEDVDKRCPECAEKVLAPARRCRFCGFRFDTGGRERPAGALETIIPGPVHARHGATMTQILAHWNVTLVADEEIRFFTAGVADDRNGYLLVTSGRIVFFAQQGRRDHETHFAYPLSSVGGVRRRGLRWSPRLMIHGPGGRHEIHGLGAALTRRIDGYLAEHGVAPLDGENKQTTV
jgi:hypothetical protein